MFLHIYAYSCYDRRVSTHIVYAYRAVFKIFPFEHSSCESESHILMIPVHRPEHSRLYVPPLHCGIEQVADWAGRCRGYFPLIRPEASSNVSNNLQGVDGEDRILLLRWNDLQPADRHRIKWAGVKPTQRAMEKLLRSYAGDSTCLLDLCRQV